MRNFFKSRLLTAALIFTLLEIAGGLLVMAPFLVFIRLQLEQSGLAFELWPLVSFKITADLVINDPRVLMVFSIAAAVIFLAYFPLKTLLVAGVYNLIIPADGAPSDANRSLSEHVRKAASVWSGFIKAALFGILAYILAFFIGLMFGGFLGKVWAFFRPLTMALLLLAASTYIQLLKIRMVISGNPSLRASIANTRTEIAGALGRIMLGNVAVSLTAVFLLVITWWLLKWVRGFEWNYLTASASIVLQQVIIILICLGQVVRINFNHSILRKGE